MFGLNSRLHTVKERINKVEDSSKEITDGNPKRKEI